MAKAIEHVHWPDAPDMWMPYAPAIKVKGGTTVYLAGVTAAPVYHHHPHRPEEFDAMPRDMEGQARADDGAGGAACHRSPLPRRNQRGGGDRLIARRPQTTAIPATRT